MTTSKKKIKITKIPKCPHCSSLRTGQISNYIALGNDKDNLEKKALKKGYFIKFVTPERYRTYYSIYNLNCFCYDCDYEFSSTITTEKVDKEEYEKYLNERRINEELCLYTKGFFSKIIKIFRYIIPFS